MRKVTAREVIDSRGDPTAEVDVDLTGGAVGRGAAPDLRSNEEALDVLLEAIARGLPSRANMSRWR
jgi:enolase